MPQLSKATLLEIDNSNQPKHGAVPVPVQFNPSSLRLQYSNQSEGGQQAGRQAQQYTGTGSTTLSVDLVFDTADEGSTTVPRSVLERTQAVEYFIKPQGDGGRNQAPPRLQFQWGQVIVQGLLDSLSVDLDHFAHDGTPLRAKASLSIKGQHPEYQFNQVGPGANTAVGATPAAAAGAGAAQPGAGSSGIGPQGLTGISGSLGAGASLSGSLGLSIGGSVNLSLGGSAQLALGGGQLSLALGGESLAALAARNGVEPAAWRALAAGVGNPARLPAGQPIVLPAAASASVVFGSGVGSASGPQAGAGATPAQRAGLDAAAGATSPLAGALQQGYALAAAGGVGAALESVKQNAGSRGATRARQDFAGAGGAAGASAQTAQTPAQATGQDMAVFSLRSDARADSFGRGVPLRDQVQVAHDQRANLLAGQARVKSPPTNLPPTTADPGVPSWVALPAAPSNAVTPATPRRGSRCGCSA